MMCMYVLEIGYKIPFQQNWNGQPDLENKTHPSSYFNLGKIKFSVQLSNFGIALHKTKLVASTFFAAYSLISLKIGAENSSKK